MTPKKCLNCDSLLRPENMKFCSRRCSSRWKAHDPEWRRRVGLANIGRKPANAFKKGNVPWNKKPQIEIRCAVCGASRLLKPSDAKRAKYCSRRCKALYLIGAGKLEGTKLKTWSTPTVQELELPPSTLGYIAGIIDGEGTIALHAVHFINRTQLMPVLSIGNTNQELINFLKTKVRMGTVRTLKPRKPHHKVAYSWGIQRVVDIKLILECVLPFLVIKKRQAELMLQYCKSRLSKFQWWTPFTDREFEIYRELKALNQKGCPITQLTEVT